MGRLGHCGPQARQRRATLSNVAVGFIKEWRYDSLGATITQVLPVSARSVIRGSPRR